MNTWKERYRDWEGTAAELARAAEVVISELALPGDEVQPTERLVRYYTQQGILRRPERRGKEAIYGRRQLAEFLACRVLLDDGWPLAKIAEFNTVNDLEPILGLLPDGRSRTEAEAAVGRLLRQAREPGRALALREDPAPFRSAPVSRATEQLMGRSREKSLLREELADLGSAEEPDPGEAWIRLQLTPGCHVYVTRDTVLNTSREALEPLGRALVQAILDARLANGGRS